MTVYWSKNTCDAFYYLLKNADEKVLHLQMKEGQLIFPINLEVERVMVKHAALKTINR